MVYNFLLEHQLNIMLCLCAISVMMVIMLLLTKFMPTRRKRILLRVEIVAALLLASDRAAYLYRGEVGSTAHFMVRFANFMVFFLTPAVVLEFNDYLIDLMETDGKVEKIPRRLTISGLASALAMLLAILAHFTGLYYTFDAQNVYHRGPGFLISYIIPVVFPLVQLSVIVEYKKVFSKLIYTSLLVFILVPIAMGILQIFTYGISIVNMAMVLVSLSLYFFSYLDINAVVEKAHEMEVEDLHKEQDSMKRLFNQTATAFVSAVEKRDVFSEGHATRVAELARRIASAAGKSEEECEKVYYAALLHDVGMIGISDAVIESADDLNGEEYEEVRHKPELSAQILAAIKEYPYLSEGAKYSCERYDGTGYPKGLKGEEIPEISRIITVADAYDNMHSRKRYRDPLSYIVIREEFVKESGGQFDPNFAEIMLQIMDAEHLKNEIQEYRPLETELSCKEYREHVSSGIPIEEEETRITFDYREDKENKEEFSEPSLILFDAYDRQTHVNIKSIEAYRYQEYGEVWFDGKYISTSARDMELEELENEKKARRSKFFGGSYEIVTGRFEDHIFVRMISPNRRQELIAALPNISKSAYIGLTCEHGTLSNIKTEKTGRILQDGDIKRLVGEISFTNRLESDLPNLQIDKTRSAATVGLLLRDYMRLDFHTMSLPTANLVWHCAYILIFNSEDGMVFGKNYKEYAMVKINGEVSQDEGCAENDFEMKKGSDFQGFNAWKEANKEGIECTVELSRKGNKIRLTTENLGV
ncbi:MAG: HD domain-containing protein, partial [Lachnospiraceae bacterium]|nr:HD domain-containing protein [Lachnospiraceae bacterium]